MSQTTIARIKLAFGIASTIAVELLAKGSWAHAVWVPVALMFATDFQKVFSNDVVGQILNGQRVRFLLGTGAAVGVELLAKGPWAHAVWVPVASMLFVNVEHVFASQLSPGSAAAKVAPEAAATASTTEVKSSDDTVTPIEKPPAK